jgi:hypothetical protein
LIKKDVIDAILCVLCPVRRSDMASTTEERALIDALTAVTALRAAVAPDGDGEAGAEVSADEQRVLWDGYMAALAALHAVTGTPHLVVARAHVEAIDDGLLAEHLPAEAVGPPPARQQGSAPRARDNKVAVRGVAAAQLQGRQVTAAQLQTMLR